MASKLDVDEIAAKNGTDPVTLTKQSAAKAWGLLNTATVRDTFGISGTTDNGTGDQTVNYINSFSDADYSFVATGSNTGTSFGAYAVDFSPTNARSSSSLRFWTGAYNALQDSTYNNFVVHGDLA